MILGGDAKQKSYDSSIMVSDVIVVTLSLAF